MKENPRQDLVQSLHLTGKKIAKKEIFETA